MERQTTALLRLMFGFGVAVSIAACSGGGDSCVCAPCDDVDSYAPLSVGDTRQMVSVLDSSTLTVTIAADTERTDGHPAFLEVYRWGAGSTIDTAYSCIIDGFYASTAIDTVRDSLGQYNACNPFTVVYRAMVDPIDGLVWSSSPCVYASPTEAVSVPPLSTHAGLFSDVYAVLRMRAGCLDSQIVVEQYRVEYYAKHIGWVGSSATLDSGALMYLAYARVGGTEYGEPWPERD